MTTETLKQAEVNQLKNLEEKYGKKLEEWKQIIEKGGLTKHGELVNMLKEKFEMGHGFANLLVHTVRQTHAGAANDDSQLIDEQYKGKEDIRQIYDFLIDKISAFGTDVELAPKKTYVSIRRKKQFAILQPSLKTRFDIGLNLKNEPPTGKLEAAGSWNSMCTHRIKIQEQKEIDADVLNYIKKAYDQAG